jgi:hypothetical protein
MLHDTITKKKPVKIAKNPHKTHKKQSKNPQKTLQKFTKNPHKNPQENQKVISFCQNIKINVDIAMRKGGIHSLGQLYYFFFK